MLAPEEYNYFSWFVKLDHQVAGSEPVIYEKGWHDFYFVGYYVFLITWTREFYIKYVLRPFAERYTYIQTEAKIVRFVEQAYAWSYFSISGTAGLWVMYQEPTWFFNSIHYWIGYPHLTFTTLFKAYYLLQLAYWLQQVIVLVLGLERPRKDFHELIAHHAITISLIVSSYHFNYTRIGNAVFITMDVSDTFLSFAKMLNYSPKTQRASEIAFIWFIIVWTFTRHYLFVFKIMKPVWEDYFRVLAVGTDLKRGYVVNKEMFWIMFSLLALLQALCIFWYFLILRIMFRFVTGQHAGDDREEDDEEPESEPKQSIKEQEWVQKQQGRARSASGGVMTQGKVGQLAIDHGDHATCT